MINKTIIDIDNWNRIEYYNFFGKMDDPFFGLTAQIDFTNCYYEAKKDNDSFFLYSLHKILKATNSLPEFKYRIEEENIVLYDKINVSSTIGREDGSFGFAFFEYFEDRNLFIINAKKEIEKVKSCSGLCLNSQEGLKNLIYFTSIPWINFTTVKHPCNSAKGESIPKISTGKLTKYDGKLMMPVSVELNHGFADGRHIAQFFDLL